MARFIFTFLTFFSLVCFGLTDLDRSELIQKNILAPYNPGFESGKALSSGTNWTIGTDTTSIDTSTPLTGKASLVWNSGGASRILASKAVTIPPSLQGTNGLAFCRIQVASGTATHTISVYDGTNTLAGPTTITSSTIATASAINFIFPTSGTVQLRLTSVAADEPSIEIDDCYIGPAANIVSVSQAEVYGRVQIAGNTNCKWVGTNSTSYNNFTNNPDSDCGTVTAYGNATSTAKSAQITFASMPPGIYKITAQIGNDVSATDLGCGFRFSDGTNTTSSVQGLPSGSAGNSPSARTIVGYLTYTTAQGATTINLQSATISGSGTCDVINSATGQIFEISVERFPLSSQLAATMDQLPAYYSAYNTTTNCGAWTVTQTTFTSEFAADADCDLTTTGRPSSNFTVTAHNSAGSELPGLTITPKRASTIFICAKGGFSTASTTNGRLRLWDGTTTIDDFATDTTTGVIYPFTLCGLYSFDSTTAKTLKIYGAASSGAITLQGGSTVTAAVNWTIIDLSNQYPMPQYVTAITSPGYTGQFAVYPFQINCDGASTTTSDPSGAVSSVGNISGGQCNITLNTGKCASTPITVNANPNTAGIAMRTQRSSATSIGLIGLTDAGGAPASFDADVLVVCPK